MTFYAIHTRKQVMVNIDPPGGTTKVKEKIVYHNGQIVHNLETGLPCKVGDNNGSQFAWDNIPKNTTHYIEVNPKYEVLPKVPTFAGGLPQRMSINGHAYRYCDYRREQEYSIALPSSIEQALELLSSGQISPAPKSKR